MTSILFKGIRYRLANELTVTHKDLQAIPMQEMVFTEYLHTIKEVDKRLRHFGWAIYPHPSTLQHDSYKVVTMRVDPKHMDRTKHTYDNLKDALHALSSRLQSSKFNDLVLHTYT